MGGDTLRRIPPHRKRGGGNTYNVVDMASLLQAVRNAGEQTWLLFGAAHTMNGTAA